jgi:hypothetical protein
MSAGFGHEGMIAYYKRQIQYHETKLAKGEALKRSYEESPGWYKRQHVWRHNAMIGHTVMMRVHLTSMIDSPSTTSETKHVARSILGLIPKLQNSLAARIDPQEK